MKPFILGNVLSDVLLAALSDTLSENPDVLEKARNAMNSTE